MKLRYSPNSPFVRKVWVSALELGLDGKVERIPTNPMKPEDVQNSPNPLGKVPCLETADGQVIFDSGVIAEYLDCEAGGGKLFPAIGPARWTALRLMAQGDGMLEAGVLRFIEGMRKPERQSKGWIAHNKAAMDRSIDALEQEVDVLDGPLTIGSITIGIALAFADFRFADEDWRADHPKLGAWFETFNARPSMQETDFFKAAAMEE